MRRLSLLLTLIVIFLVFTTTEQSAVTETSVTGVISLVNSKAKDMSNIAVWLEPVSSSLKVRPQKQRPAIHQTKKRFVPRVLIVPIGQEVEFPNDDSFPHNVFSNSEIKRMDLGLYSGGESRTEKFTRIGVVPLFCNIHPQMKAYIITVKTPYFALSNERGEINIDNVSSGKYRLKIWHERVKDTNLKDGAIDQLTREVSISAGNTNLGTIQIDEAGYSSFPHKNKEGKDYLQSN